MAKFDPTKFNTDPKHQEERDFLDAITEESVKRIAAKKKKENPASDDANFFDKLFGGKDD